jgi:hypothetical protein
MQRWRDCSVHDLLYNVQVALLCTRAENVQMAGLWCT